MVVVAVEIAVGERTESAQEQLGIVDTFHWHMVVAAVELVVGKRMESAEKQLGIVDTETFFVN